MLTASFDMDRSSGAVIRGAVQYDTGQRLKLCGLPSPWELGRADALLSESEVTVQAQFARDGDTQGESVLVAWDKGECEWIVSIPDEYLTRAEPVRVYVYVYYGEDGMGGFRGKTMYEGVFTPRSRSAPKNMATPEQLEWLSVTLDEVQLALDAGQAAQEKAEAGAQSAQDAAAAANAAASSAASAGNRLSDAGSAFARGAHKAVSAQDAGAAESGGTLTLTTPRGAAGAAGKTGAKGQKGDTGETGPADVAFALSGGVLNITTL